MVLRHLLILLPLVSHAVVAAALKETQSRQVFPVYFPDNNYIAFEKANDGITGPRELGSMFTIWERPRNDFVIFFSPSMDVCSVIKLCPVTMHNATSLQASSVKCDKGLTIYPMENMVYQGGDSQGKGHTFVGQEALFVKSPTSYRLVVHETFDGSVAKKIDLKTHKKFVNLEIDANDKLALLTSNPQCYATITMKAHPDQRNFMIPTVSKNSIDINSRLAVRSKKTFKHLILHSELQSFKVIDREEYECCPRFWEPTGFHYTWRQRLHEVVYQRYEIAKRLPNCDGAEKTTEMFDRVYSVSMHGENLHRCEWQRLCFGTKKDSSGFCTEEKASLEILTRHSLYIPTDSDDARILQVNPAKLTHIRFRFYPMLKLMQMSYMFMGRRLAAVNDWMKLDWNPVTPGNHIDFGYSRCRIRLASDFISMKYDRNGKNCLNIKSCQCLEPGKKSINSVRNQFMKPMAFN